MGKDTGTLVKSKALIQFIVAVVAILMPLNTTTAATAATADIIKADSSLNASPSLQRAEITIKYRKLNPYTTGEINVLLLENISPNAVDIFKRAGFNVITQKRK